MQRTRSLAGLSYISFLGEKKICGSQRDPAWFSLASFFFPPGQMAQVFTSCGHWSLAPGYQREMRTCGITGCSLETQNLVPPSAPPESDLHFNKIHSWFLFWLEFETLWLATRTDPALAWIGCWWRTTEVRGVLVPICKILCWGWFRKWPHIWWEHLKVTWEGWWGDCHEGRGVAEGESPWELDILLLAWMKRCQREPWPWEGLLPCTGGKFTVFLMGFSWFVYVSKEQQLAVDWSSFFF